MVLTKVDRAYMGEHGKEILTELKEYRTLVGEIWPPFNYDLGYGNINEWHDALIAELEKAHTKAS